MRDFSVMRSLIGESLTENDLRNVDCYVHKKVGLFIPSTGRCGYASKKQHSHPSYMICIFFSYDNINALCEASQKRNHYRACIMSPGISHDDVFDEYNHYYCIMIDKDYFESQYALYSEDTPYFEMEQFEMCKDILKALNTFAFEYSKSMKNSDITLDAQMIVITHWIIRSVLGENLDMRAVSDNYAVARAQHYIAQHFSEDITADDLSKLVHMSQSSFNRLFRKETGISPHEYIIEEKVEKSKTLLRRNDITVTDIAVRCGFGSGAHFASVFKRVTGFTPSQYRSSYMK